MVEPASAQCPAQADLIRFVAGDLDDRQGLVIFEHIESCSGCQAVIAQIDQGDALFADMSPECIAATVSHADLRRARVLCEQIEVRLCCEDGLQQTPLAGVDVVEIHTGFNVASPANSRVSSTAGVVGVFALCLLLTAVLVTYAFSVVRTQWGSRAQHDFAASDSEGVSSMADTRRRKKQADLRANQVQVVEPRVLLAAANAYVDSSFTGSSTGSSTNPYKTIMDAVNAINAGTALGMTGVADVPGSVINIKAGNGTTTGVYRETIDASAKTNFNGTATNPIRFQKWGTGTVTIKGTDLVGTVANDFSLTSGQSYYETTAMNWTQGIGKDQIFVNGEMLTWARSNDKPYTNVLDKVSSGNWATIDSVTTDNVITKNSRRFTITSTSFGGNAQNWVGGYIHLLPGGEWIGQSGVVRSGSTGNTLIVDVMSYYAVDAEPGSVNAYKPVAGNHFYLTGKLNGLSQNGEWFRDPVSNKLYVRVPTGVDPDNVTVEAKKRTTAINVSGRSYIVFDGIDVFGANVLTSASSVGMTFKNMTVKYASHYDLTTDGPWTVTNDWLNQWPNGSAFTSFTWGGSGWGFGTNNTGIVLEGTGHRVENSTIQYSAGNGITVKGNDHKIINNAIYDTDYMATDAGAIFTSGVTNRIEIAYNTISRSGRSSIVHRDTKASSIHHNDISHSMWQSADGGAVYTYINDGKGTVIAYNKIHDHYAFGDVNATHYAVGLYLDNNSSNYSLHHNLVYDVRQALTLNTGAANQNHRIVNNTLIGDDGAVGAWGGNDPLNWNMTGTELWNNVLVGAVSGSPITANPGIIKSGNLQFASRSSIPATVFTNLATDDLTLPFGSIAGDYGSTATNTKPFSFGYTGSAPAAGALDIGQTVFVAGKQASISAIPLNNGLLGLAINPGETIIGAGQYDSLGEGVSYHDNDQVNAINQNYGGNWRPGEGVDATSAQIGYTTTGEWVQYTLDVKTAGSYTLDFSTDGAIGNFTVKVGNGSTFTTAGTVTTVASGYTTPLTLTLGKGIQVLRLEIGSVGGFNIYNIRLNSVQKPYGTLTTIAPTGTTTIQPGFYDEGGQGVAYSDGNAGNQLSSFRASEGVDAGLGGTYIGYAGNTEYLEYTINVAQTGNYNITFTGDTGWVPINSLLMNVLIGDGVNFTQIGSVTSPVASGAFSVTLNKVLLQAGIQVIKLDIKNAFNPKQFSFTNAQTPYGTLTTVASTGNTVILPGSYDNGGQNVAYFDASTGNTISTTFRPGEDVDAVANQIGYTNTGEWVEYSFNVAEAGTYNIDFEVNGIAGTLGVDIGDGGFFSPLGNVAIPAVSSGKAFSPIIQATLKAGQQVLRLRFVAGGFNIYQIRFANAQQPWSTTLPVISSAAATVIKPGEYDLGGESVAYHDTGSTNLIAVNHGGTWRTTEGVDAAISQIGYPAPGEWVEYTVNVTTAGVYNFDVNADNTGTLLLKKGDTTLGTYVITTTGSGYKPAIQVTLQAGIQTLRIELVSGGYNLYGFRFTYLHALEAESAGGNTSAAVLTTQQAAPIFAEAKRRWQNLGVQASAFNGVTFSIADLPDNTLAVSSGKSITIDSNAANWGWFVDPTPGNDREFTLAGNQGEQNRMDLLTTVTHELGHVLGLEHTENGVMEGTLSAGERDMPSASDFVAVTSGGGTSTVRRTHAISETAGVPVAATSPVGTLRRPWWWG